MLHKNLKPVFIIHVTFKNNLYINILSIEYFHITNIFYYIIIIKTDYIQN